MKLQSKSSTNYVKFNDIRDSVSGRFVSYEEGVDGTFGPENILTIDTGRGRAIIRCTSHLSSLISDNLESIKPGARMRIELVELRPTNKGSPMKVFEVDLPEGEAAEEKSSESGKDDLPF